MASPSLVETSFIGSSFVSRNVLLNGYLFLSPCYIVSHISEPLGRKIANLTGYLTDKTNAPTYGKEKVKNRRCTNNEMKLCLDSWIPET
ncbi:hypothetical protein JTE90_027321 [Oedothorax gibbosus]|uniref:Uncharacterized protein n=1 Tax=Oedothorax gibbosus TaxID=931172 RepID=A0AAV6W3N3_9ARAC|nr:hypothetical protein JTE90_027321 [Oedothorax gibbosus]